MSQSSRLQAAALNAIRRLTVNGADYLEAGKKTIAKAIGQASTGGYPGVCLEVRLPSLAPAEASEFERQSVGGVRAGAPATRGYLSTAMVIVLEHYVRTVLGKDASCSCRIRQSESVASHVLVSIPLIPQSHDDKALEELFLNFQQS